MSAFNPLNPPAPDALFRVMARYRKNGELELWNNYHDQDAAEEAARGLLTSGHAVESEVLRVGAAPGNPGRVASFRLVYGRVERRGWQ